MATTHVAEHATPPSPLSEGSLSADGPDLDSPPTSPPQPRVAPRTDTLAARRHRSPDDEDALRDNALRARFGDDDDPWLAPERLFDVDSRHGLDPAFAGCVAEEIYEFLRSVEKERLRGDGLELTPAECFGTGDDYRKERQYIINWLFEKNLRHMDCHHDREPLVSTDTVHLAVYYMDRFVESYKGDTQNLLTVMFTAVHLASKYVEIYPVELYKIRQFLSVADRNSFTARDICQLEHDFLLLLKDFMGPTTTAFAHRYLQTVGMETNKAAVHTTRYLCALAICNYDLTGEYYSKIAAAAVFITYNKYSAATSGGQNVISFPEGFAHHSGYTLDEIEPVVVALASYAQRIERAAQSRNTEAKNFPMGIYQYYKRAGIVTTKTYPDFGNFFHKRRVEEEPPPRRSQREAAAAESAGSN